MKHILIIILLIFITCLEAKEEFSKKEFEKVIKTIKKTSLYKLTDSEIYEGAIKGVLSKLEEKNPRASKRLANQLLPPKRKKDLKQEIKGEITGIGVVVRYDKRFGDRYPVVTQVLDGGAKTAGVHKGDEIVKIGRTVITHDKSMRALVDKIRGPVGSKVMISILRNGEILKKDITRKKIPYKSVELSFPRPKLGLLKIKYFNDKTFKEAEKALYKMKDSKVTACMVDMRTNTGGHLDQGTKTLKLFAKKGDELFHIERKNGKHKVVKAEKDGIDINCRWAVLVDNETASFGEVFSNTLKRIKHATIIGNNTYGKSSMESFLPLKNGYMVKYTVGRIRDPKGKTWEGKGIRPDIFINFDQGPQDQYLLNSAINFLLR